MISITSKTGSSNGIIFQELLTSILGDLKPRVSKSKTLDGGVVFDHRGMITGDRQLLIRANLNAAQKTILQNLVKNETYLNLACDEGFFDGVISDLSFDASDVSIFFLVRQ